MATSHPIRKASFRHYALQDSRIVIVVIAVCAIIRVSMGADVVTKENEDNVNIRRESSHLSDTTQFSMEDQPLVSCVRGKLFNETVCDLMNLTKSSLWTGSTTKVQIKTINRSSSDKQNRCFSRYDAVDSKQLYHFVYDGQYCISGFKDDMDQEYDFQIYRKIDQGYDLFDFDVVENNLMISSPFENASSGKERFFKLTKFVRYKEIPAKVVSVVYGRQIQLEWNGCVNDGRRCRPKITKKFD